MRPISVLAVTSELFPLIKTGGLADVAGALPLALTAQDVATTSLLPGYPVVLAGIADAEAVYATPDWFGGPARLLRGQAAGLDLLVLDAPHLYARPGGPYAGPDGSDWPDNAIRFAALARMAAFLGQDGLPGFTPDILHGHDWQAGLAMAYLHYAGGRRPGTVMTVHNLAFQGLFDASLLAPLGLPPASFVMEGVEFYGMIGFLKAGLALADRITTVSPSYAAEIQQPETGMGLDGLLRYRAGVLRGIANGIDDAIWDPAADPMLAARFDAATLDRRADNKRALQARFGLRAAPDALLLGVISRLTWQKGLDQLLDVMPALVRLDMQLAVLGTGEREMEEGFAAAAARHPGQIGFVRGYDEGLAHLMQGGIDALLVPSRFEPCGLTQLYALRYGALPVVARVGGLADTVADANEAAGIADQGTGIHFAQGEMGAALARVAALWQRPAMWRHLQRNAMASDVSWRHPAAEYAAVYRGLVPD